MMLLELFKEAKQLGAILYSKISWKQNAERRTERDISVFFLDRLKMGQETVYCTLQSLDLSLHMVFLYSEG